MFIGHFGVALAAKKFAPRTSLGTTAFAAEFVDLLWPALLLLGIEHVAIAPGITRMSPFDFTDYPISHSLLMSVVWAVVVGGVYFAVRRYPVGAWVVGLTVLSHWFLDLLVHRPDLLLIPGGRHKFGLGLWNHPLAEVSIEIALFVVGAGIYASSTRAKDAIGRYAFWAFVVFLFLGWVGTLRAGAPPTVSALAWGGLSMWLMVLWAWWADRHREVIGEA
jgi:hypothetical protein